MAKTLPVTDGKRLTDHAAKEVRVSGDQKLLICDYQGETVEIEFDQILVAVGRKANTTGFGLEELGVQISARGTIETDPFLRTNFPNILCAGDVAGPYQFTHTAGHQAWFAAVNSLFSGLKKFKVDFTQRFDDEPKFPSVLAYEATQLLLKALQQNPDPNSLTETLKNMGVMEGLQDSFQLDKHGDVDRPSYINQVQKGRFVRLNSK